MIMTLQEYLITYNSLNNREVPYSSKAVKRWERETNKIVKKIMKRYNLSNLDARITLIIRLKENNLIRLEELVNG